MSNAVKNTTFPRLLDLISPHRCLGCGTIGQPLCQKCQSFITQNHINLCPLCGNPTITGKCSQHPNLPPTFITGELTDLLGHLIHNFKYHSNRTLAKPLAQIINSTLPTLTSKNTIIIPLPTIPQHIRARGLDHTLLLAKNLAKIRGSNYHVKQALIRAHHHVQVGSSRQTRLRQALSAYQISPTFTLQPDATYIILDDVWTTGASMQSATHLLKSLEATKIIQTTLAISNQHD